MKVLNFPGRCRVLSLKRPAKKHQGQRSSWDKERWGTSPSSAQEGEKLIALQSFRGVIRKCYQEGGEGLYYLMSVTGKVFPLINSINWRDVYQRVESSPVRVTGVVHQQWIDPKRIFPDDGNSNLMMIFAGGGLKKMMHPQCA